MNKFLLAVALVAACSSPVSAGSGKVRAKHAHPVYAPTRFTSAPALSASQMRSADITEVIPTTLIGSLASPIMGTWCLRRSLRRPI
jgi:hypothetical protein